MERVISAVSKVSDPVSGIIALVVVGIFGICRINENNSRAVKYSRGYATRNKFNDDHFGRKEY